MFLFFKNTFYVHNSNWCGRAPDAKRTGGSATARLPRRQSKFKTVFAL